MAADTHGFALPRYSVVKAPEFPTLRDFAPKGKSVGTGDATADTDAFLNAVAWAVENRAAIRLGHGVFNIAQGADDITAPISILGESAGLTFLKLTKEFSGTLLPVLNCGFGPESNAFPINGATAWVNDVSDLTTGLRIDGFAIIGDKTNGMLQKGIELKGNVDHFDIHGLLLAYLSGGALNAGIAYNGVRGQIREGTISKLRVRHCGKLDGTASLSFLTGASPSNPTADASNLFVLDDIHVVFPYGRGLEIKDTSTSTPFGPLYGISAKKIMVHGRHVTDTRNVGALVHIEGRIQSLDMDLNIAYSDVGDYAVRIAPNPTTGDIPSSINIDVALGEVYRGIEIVDGANVSWNVKRGAFVRREMMVLGANTYGPITVENKGDEPFVKTVLDATMNGTAKVVFAGLQAAEGILTFFPAEALHGTGDTMKCEVGGITGTLNRNGSVDDGSHWYEFTPDADAGTLLIRAGSGLSKYVIPRAKWPKFNGRFRYTPLDRYGIETLQARILGGGTLKFATGMASGETDQALNVYPDGNLVMRGFDKAGAAVDIFSIYPHFDGGDASMNMAVPLVPKP